LVASHALLRSGDGDVGQAAAFEASCPLHVCRSLQAALRTPLGTVLQAAVRTLFVVVLLRLRDLMKECRKSFSILVVCRACLRNLVSWVGAPTKQINPLRVRADLGFRAANSNSVPEPTCSTWWKRLIRCSLP